MEGFVQLAISGIAIGSIYALVGLGFSLIYNASHAVNLAQGEFVMLGGILAAAFLQAGLPLGAAALLAILCAGLVGVLMSVLTIEPRRDAETLMLMLITLGVGIIVRGLVILFWDKETHTIPPIGGEGLLQLGNVTIVPQALWIVFAMVIVLVAVDYFFRRTLMGKSIKAVSINGLAAQLVGINVPQVLRICFGLSAVIGGLAGVLITPVTYMAFDSGLALSIKGFSAAIIGGMGHGMGAVVGGLLLGLTEAMAAGYLSSAYKDVVALAMILLVMLAAPNGIFGVKGAERV